MIPDAQHLLRELWKTTLAFQARAIGINAKVKHDPKEGLILYDLLNSLSRDYRREVMQLLKQLTQCGPEIIELLETELRDRPPEPPWDEHFQIDSVVIDKQEILEATDKAYRSLVERALAYLHGEPVNLDPNLPTYLQAGRPPRNDNGKASP